MTTPHPSPVQVDAGVARTGAVWRTALDALTDDAVGEPSRLPGWTRGHVLAHVAGLGSAVVRQAQAAVEGEVLEFYPGGRPARDRAIDEGAGASAAEHAERLRATIDRVETALAALDDAALARPTGYRDRPASALALLWWREALVHLVDADLGFGHLTAWDGPFRAHLVAYLAPRVPTGLRLLLEGWDTDEQHVVGDGETLVVQGMANDVVAWLAGREPGGSVLAERDGIAVPLPELEPWP